MNQRPLPPAIARAIAKRDQRAKQVIVDPYAQSGGYLACFDKDPNAQDNIAHLQKGLNDAKMWAQIAKENREEQARESGSYVSHLTAADGHRSMNCYNCHVAVHPNPDLIAVMGQHCSPNCALRTYLNEFEEGYCFQALHDIKCQKLFEFFGDLKPFPKYTDQWQNDIVAYHFTAMIPPNYPIAYYYLPYSEDEQQRRKQQHMDPDAMFTDQPDDQMELN